MAEQQDYDSPGRTSLICNSRSSWPSSFPAPTPRSIGRLATSSWTKSWKITLDAVLGRRMVDKLVRVQLQDGREQWVLVHVEVQMQPAIGFPERMFVYHYRIRDRFAPAARLSASWPTTIRAGGPANSATSCWAPSWYALQHGQADGLRSRLAGAGERDQPLRRGGDGARGHVCDSGRSIRPTGLKFRLTRRLFSVATTAGRSSACIVSSTG